VTDPELIAVPGAESCPGERLVGVVGGGWVRREPISGRNGESVRNEVGVVEEIANPVAGIAADKRTQVIKRMKGMIGVR